MLTSCRTNEHVTGTMESLEKQDAAASMKRFRRRCVLRLVGRAGVQREGLRRRRTVLRDGFWHCTSLLPCHTAARKPAMHRLRQQSARQKDSADFDSSVMDMSPDHSKLNHRRSSLPMDYRSLAGMTPKWYANLKGRFVLKQKQSTVSDQEESTNAEKHLEMVVQDNGLSIPGCSDVSPTTPRGVILAREPGISYKTEAPFTLVIKQCSDIASSQKNPNFVEKLIFSMPENIILSPSDQLVKKCSVNSDGFYNAVILPASSVPVSLNDSGEAAATVDEDTPCRTVLEDVDTCTESSASDCCMIDKPTVGSVTLSNSSDTVYRNASCCSSGCDCFSFCYSSVEGDTNVLLKNNRGMDGSVMSAAYIGCDGSSCKLTCDLHLVGALETVSESADMEFVNGMVDGCLEESAATVSEHEDFVDNVCVDCGCELLPDDMTECAFSVPVCGICSQDVDHSVPSVDDVSADHGYACFSTESFTCSSPQKVPVVSPIPSTICQQPRMPEVDIVDDITFLSFPSKYLMQKYVACRQNGYEPTVKSSQMKLASWHGSHRSVKWFGSSRHRHIDRFNAHSRLNEQVELGLMIPVSAQDLTDLHGIRLKSLSRNNSHKTVVGRKLKCRNKHLPSDSIQRPTRVAAIGRHYSLTRFRRKGLRTLADTEGVVITKLSQQCANNALELLHVPPIITRYSCSKPGCSFGCICHLFIRNRFSSVIGAEFDGSIAVPEIPVIDDSWRQKLLPSSADTSFTSSADESLDQLNNTRLSLDNSIAAAASPRMSMPSISPHPMSYNAAADARNSLEQHGRHHKKHTKRSLFVGSGSDNPTLSLTVLLPHKRRWLKRRRSEMVSFAGDANHLECGTSPVQEKQQVQNLSSSLPSNDDGGTELGELHAKKRRRRRRLKSQELAADGSNLTEPVVHKKRRRSSSGKKSTPGTGKKAMDDAIMTVSTSSQEQVVKAGGAMVGDSRLACSADGNIPRTDTTTMTSPALYRAKVRLQDIATGKCYVLQPAIKGVAHSSEQLASKQGIAAYSVQPVSGTVDTAKCRLVLGRIGVVGHRRSATVNIRRSPSSANTAAIPRLVPVAVSPLVSTTTTTATVTSSSSSSSAAVAAAPCLASLLNESLLISPASGSVSTSSSGNCLAPSTQTFSQSIVWMENSASGSGQQLSTTASSSSSNVASVSMAHKPTAVQPYRTQMILFQQKPDSGAMSSKTRLLEIASNGDWDRVRPKVLAWLSDLTKNSDSYPRMCSLSVGGFRVEVLPRPQQPTEIPQHLRECLGMTAMIAIRVRITPEARLLPSSVHRSLAAAATAAHRLRQCNGLNPASIHGLPVVSLNQKTAVTDIVDLTQPSTDVTQHKPASTVTRPQDTGKRTMVDSSQQTEPVAGSTYISQQKSNQQSSIVNVSQHSPIILSDSTDSSSTDDADESNSVCTRVDSGGILQNLPKPSFGVCSDRTGVQDMSDDFSHCCGEDTAGFDLNSCTNTSIDNRDSGAVLKDGDAGVINNNGISIDAACILNSVVHADAGNLSSSADSGNFPSSLSQSLPSPNSTEVACSLQSDDGNFPSTDDGSFPSSSGVSVSLACPLDLRT